MPENITNFPSNKEESLPNPEELERLLEEDNFLAVVDYLEKIVKQQKSLMAEIKQAKNDSRGEVSETNWETETAEATEVLSQSYEFAKSVFVRICNKISEMSEADNEDETIRDYELLRDRVLALFPNKD